MGDFWNEFRKPGSCAYKAKGFLLSVVVSDYF